VEVIGGIVALLAGTILVLGATFTGNQETLCKAMGGTYTPSYGDVCPGGSWANLTKPK
jgi:hypothetical protein